MSRHKTYSVLLVTITGVALIMAILKYPNTSHTHNRPPEKTGQVLYIENQLAAVTKVAPVQLLGQQYIRKDVDLPEDLQYWMIDYCYSRHISPYLIMSAIEQESGCNPDAIGDDGESIGLMQIQPGWHKERMDKLHVTDLRDPKQNIIVGVDILLELFHENPSLDWVLMAYNGGRKYADRMCQMGQISPYAEQIMKRAYELEGGT